jgi:hypothetical protein
MTRSIRTLLGVAAVAAATSIAGAQAPQHDSTTAHSRATHGTRATHARTHADSGHTANSATAAARKPTHKHGSSSGGEVDLVRTGSHATSRDYYGADDPRCDDLCQHEKMMDARYGKDRERLAGKPRGS